MDYEIITKGKIILKNINYHENISEKTKRQISHLWNSEIKSKNNLIFDDKVVCFIRINPKNKTEIEVGYTNYKTILVDRKFPKLGLNIYQIGVSGLILINDEGNELILFAKRSKDVTEYPDFYELVPSGNLDKTVLTKDNTIDYESKIIEEFKEETDLPVQVINKLTPFCFVKDKINHVYDVCCILEINIDHTLLYRSFKNVSEFHSPHFVPVKNLKNFIDKNESNIVPTSKAILKCFLEKDLSA